MSTPVAPTSAPATATSSAPSNSPSPSSSPTPSAPSAPSGNSSSSAPATPKAPSSGSIGDMAASAVAKATGNEPAPSDATAPTDQLTKAPTEAPKQFKVKINGEERTLNEEQLLRYASLGGGADARFAEAKQMREAADGLVNALRSDPMSVLTHPDLGINFRELAEQYLAGEIQREMMPPEQRELAELKAWKAQQEQIAEQQRTEHTTRAQQQQMQALQQKAAKEYDMQITESLARSDLPRRPETIRDVAAEMHRAMEHGYEIDVPTAVAMVRDRYSQTIQSTLGGLDGESLVKTLGDDLVYKIRKYDIARLKAAQQGIAPAAPAPQAAPAANTRPRQPQQTYLSPTEWAAANRKKAGLE